MWKKTILALATVAALAGFGSLFESAPAAAQGMHRPPPRMQTMRMHAPRPMIARPMHWRGDRPVRPPYRHWHGPRHRAWYGWGYGWGYRPWAPPPGVYGYYTQSTCRVVWRKVRVWTDDGWRRRWRKVRYCA